LLLTRKQQAVCGHPEARFPSKTDLSWLGPAEDAGPLRTGFRQPERPVDSPWHLLKKQEDSRGCLFSREDLGSSLASRVLLWFTHWVEKRLLLHYCEIKGVCLYTTAAWLWTCVMPAAYKVGQKIPSAPCLTTCWRGV
jgi:hypothetical protein